MAHKPRQEHSDKPDKTGQSRRVLLWHSHGRGAWSGRDFCRTAQRVGIQAGDKLLIWKHPSGKGVMLFPVDAVREFMNKMLANLEHAERGLSFPSEPKEEGGRMKNEDTRD